MQGMLASVNATGNSFILSIPDGVTLTIQTNNGTEFQGIGSLGELTAGMFVDMDAALQSDGSLLATRINVQDKTARDVFAGPVAQIFSSSSVIGVFQREQQGQDLTGNNVIGCCELLQYASSSTFQTSGQFTNQESLPFLANFNSSNLALGQNVYVSASSVSFTGGTYSQATTITLMPQTINGTVSTVSSIGNFQVYDVSLDSSDFITALGGANTVVVYVDSNTQMLNSTPVGPGRVFRFNGLLFNDSGTLRMDCGQINDACRNKGGESLLSKLAENRSQTYPE